MRHFQPFGYLFCKWLGTGNLNANTHRRQVLHIHRCTISHTKFGFWAAWLLSGAQITSDHSRVEQQCPANEGRLLKRDEHQTNTTSAYFITTSASTVTAYLPSHSLCQDGRHATFTDTLDTTNTSYTSSWSCL